MKIAFVRTEKAHPRFMRMARFRFARGYYPARMTDSRALVPKTNVAKANDADD